MVNICVLGSSLNWTPKLVTDLMAVFDEPLEIRLIDINSEASRLCAEWGEAATKYFGRRDRFIPFTDRRKALEGADAILITLSTGGLQAMEHDLKIPEKYGVFATVGDTAGPGGWSRSVRNIPVFMEFAEDFQKICPTAFIANYTNPMSSLTGALALRCGNPVVGLCHAYFETKDVIQGIFGLEDWSRISVSIAGMNHFTWIVDFKIGREDGYGLLRRKIGQGSLRDVLPNETADEIGFISGHELCIDLYDAFGYIPYPADRHISEFVSFAVSGFPGRHTTVYGDNYTYDTIDYCNVRRTDISHRQVFAEKARNEIIKDIEMMSKSTDGKPVKSRETGADMIHGYLYNRPVTDAVNALNMGQIPGLPLGACVETLGVVDGMGVRPLMVANVPEHLIEIMRPQAVCQKWLTEGMMSRNPDMVMQALYRDPQCTHLKPNEIQSMGMELLEANRKFVDLGF